MPESTIVKNKTELASTELRRKAIRIIEAGIRRVLPPTLVKTNVQFDKANRRLTVAGRTFDLSARRRGLPGRIFVVGGGKAVGLMAEELERILGAENIFAGAVNCLGASYGTKKIETVQAGHPTPDARGEAGTLKMLSLKDRHSIGERDVVLCLISGGGSAMMPCPAEGLTLREKQETTRLLLGSGADIREINVLRKHLSRIKGGRLGRFFAPAKVVSLIISDVVGNDLESIASGPTTPDSSTFADAYRLLEKYELTGKVPDSVLAFLQRGRLGMEEETPKSLDNCHNFIVGDNILALRAMAAEARQLGLKPLILTSEQTGDPAQVAQLRAREIIAGKYSGYRAIIIGGETTPRLPDKPGKGGRNQHYAAVTLLAMKDYPGEWVMASVGTDGSDFLRNVAGAMVDRSLALLADSKGVDVASYVQRFDTNTLFGTLGQGLIITGDTGTNVSDVLVYLLS
jgi:glycerate 2-kinase